MDELRNFVEKMSDGKLKCKFCGQLFSAMTSITRFKWHWSKVEGRGVKTCNRVTNDVREAAFQSIQQAPNKKRKIMPSSRNTNEAIHAIPPTQGQINEVDNLEAALGEERASSSAEAAGYQMENVIGGMIQTIDRSFCPDRLIVDANEPRGDAQQATDIVGQVELEGTNWNDIASIARFMEVDVENGDESRGDAFPTKKLVGGEFDKNKKAIWTWLMNDEASSSLAVYGMGGVGKTTLLTHIYNLLLKTPNFFRHVYWITVSQDFSISKLQNLIGREFQVDLSREDNGRKRAAKLSKELSREKQWVLILDDLWNYFDFDEVGIPVQVKGCKLIITTRLRGVCQRMVCQKMIKVEPLSSEEAWTLFVGKLGYDTTLPPTVVQIAKSVARECAGLPLGIITMAGTMRGVVDIREWRNVLEEMVESKVRQDDMEPEVFRILRFSYTHLKDSALQQCFLYCSLFPEDFEVDRNDLIGYLIDEGVIKGMKSRQAEFDRGHAILNKLLNVCLLERGRNSGDESVRMHDLIRDMALQIQQENSQVMVKAGAQLIELPDAEEWTENLVRVSLMENRIVEVPSSYSPRCPNLSTLLLSNNELEFIADCFFEQLLGLRVLNLSYTNIEKLPDSVSNLVSLTALLLKRCRNLRNVPSLKNLRALRRLDLSNTALEEMPQGLKQLSNLRYLRLNGVGEKEFPSGILSKLSHLQVLILEEFVVGTDSSITVKGKEVARLRKLETLQCHFANLSDLMEFVKSRDGTQSPSTYKIRVGQFDVLGYPSMIDMFSKKRSIGLANLRINGDGDFQVMFLNNIEELMILKCDDAIRSLCDVSSLKCATELEDFYIRDCNGMESLVSSSWFCSASPPSLSNRIFSGLKKFYCCGCTSMKNLFPPLLLPNLVNLEEIEVYYCKKMEDIIAREDEGVMGEEFSLPKLRSLRLKDLPALKSICSAKLICDSLQQIDLWDCPKLKRMPISLVLLDNGQPSPPPSLRRIDIKPKEWWETEVDWEHPNAKEVLRPFVSFWGPRSVTGRVLL